MKKFIKSLSLICLAILMVCPLMLAGCSKNFTVKVEMVGGGTSQILSHATEGVNVVGKNTVKEGSKFEIAIKPAEGYIISEIYIDNEEYTETYVNTGCEIYLDDIKADHTIKVVFDVVNRYVLFQCLEDGDTGNYVTYNQTITSGTESILVNGVATVKHDTVLNLAEKFAYGTGTGKIEWKLWNGLVEIDAANEMLIKGDYIFRVAMTKAEIDAILLG